MIGLYTKKVDNATFLIPDKFNQCFINNIGGASAKFKGESRNPDTGVLPEEITIPSQKSFSLPYVGVTYEGFEIDATGTIVEIVLIY